MSMPLFVLALVVIAFGLGSLVYAVFAAGRRRRHGLRGVGAVLGGVALMIVAIIISPAFQTSWKADRARIVQDAEARREEAVQERADRAAAAAQALAERAAAEARDKAARAAAEAEAAAACRADVACWAAKFELEAAFACDDAVERLAKFSSRWTDGMLEPKFSRVRWGNRAAGTVVFLGDRIEFQNGFGAFQPHVYACEYDPEGRRVVNVSARPGRL